MVSICLHSNFSGGLRKTISFLQEWRFGRSRSSKVIDFGVNRKRVWDFLLVRNSNLGPILHRFGDFAAFKCSWPHRYSTLILGVFPLHQIAHVGELGVSKRISLKLFGGEIIFKVCIPSFSTYVITVPKSYRRTDRRHVAWRGKKQYSKEPVSV